MSDADKNVSGHIYYTLLVTNRTSSGHLRYLSFDAIETGGTQLANSATTTPGRNSLHRITHLRPFVINGIAGGTRSPAVNERGLGGTGELDPIQDYVLAQGGRPRHHHRRAPISLPEQPKSTFGLRMLRRSGAGGPIASGLLLTSVLLLSACAHAPADPEARADYDRTNDPAEPTNRTIFAGNQFVDHHALQPIARGYEDYVPGRVRKSIHNFVGNLGQPSVAINDVLQGNFSRAWNTTQRFAINTTAGGIGLFDVATDWDRPEHNADFGQTLGVWGAGPGPAVQLPLFGPSNVRDGVGKVVGMVTNPTSFVSGGAAAVVSTASGGLGAVDSRAGLLSATDSLEHTSLDYYATLRSVMAQRRAALVAEGKAGLVTNHQGDATAPSKLSQASLTVEAE
jgi:phospholipid-binding lipoprotein MlaA